MASAIDKAGGTATRLKRSQASLFGGVACGIAAFVLVLLLMGGPSVASVAAALIIGGALGAWVRLADL